MGSNAVFGLLIVPSLAIVAGAQTKISGAMQCGKPDIQQAIEVGDRSHHSLIISQTKCTSTKGDEIAGTQAKENVVTGFDESNGNTALNHGYVVTTMTSGGKSFARYQGSTTIGEAGASSTEGKWSYTGGAGKLKGIKGRGTFSCKGTADSYTCESEGEYTLPSK